MSANTGTLAGKARVWLGLDDEDLQRGLKTAQRKLRDFGNSVQAVGRDLMSIGGIALTAMAVPVKYASDLEEVTNKFNVVFADSKKIMEDWSNSTAKEVGRSKRQIKEFVASAQDLLVPIGFEAGAAQEFSKQIVKLSLDLASFNNMRDEDTMRDLQAALTGSGEVMKKYGVIVSEAAVKQELFNMSIDPKVASEQEKVLARLNIIMRGTTAAQGDVARSSDSVANRLKKLKGNLEDSAAAIGNALLPMVSNLLKDFSELSVSFGIFAENNQGLVSFIAKTSIGIVALGAAINGVGIAFKVTSGAVWLYGKAIDNAIIKDALYSAATKKIIVSNSLTSLSFKSLGASIKAAFIHIGLIYTTIELGYKLGKVLGDVADKIEKIGNKATGTDKALKSVFDISPMMQFRKYIKLSTELEELQKAKLQKSESNAGLIKNWKKQLDAQKITFEQYVKNITQLGGIDMVPDPFEIEESSTQDINKINNDAISDDVAQKNLETHMLSLQLVYKEFELKRKILELEKNEEIRKAANNKQMIDAINAQYAIKERIVASEEMAAKIAIEKSEKEKSAAEAKIKAEERLSINNLRKQTIAELELQAAYSGYELERKMLELSRQRARAEAISTGASVELVEKEYALLAKIINNKEAASKVKKISETITSRGQFGSTAINRVFGSGQSSSLEKSNNEIAKNTGDLLKYVKNAETLTFN